MQRQMQQIQMANYGEADVLQLIKRPVPDPEPGELLIKMEAAGVNYSDILRRRNTYFMPTPLPYTPGAEAVGEIVKIGHNSDNHSFEIGQRVLAILPAGGGYSEYFTAAAPYCVPLPPSITSTEATAIFVQGSTAHLILHQLVQHIKGKTILIHSAAGGVGSLLVQLAKLEGAKVIATASADRKLLLARQLGADITVNYSQSGWTDRIIEQNSGHKVDVVLEMVGGNIFTESFRCLKPGGTMIVYGAASGQKGMIHSEHYVDESHNLLSFNLAYFIQNRMQDWQQSLGAVISLMAEGKLKAKISHAYSLKQAGEAHRAMEERESVGKLVLIP